MPADRSVNARTRARRPSASSRSVWRSAGLYRCVFAPKSGEETRNQIRSSIKDATREITNKLNGEKPAPLVTL